MLKTCVVCGKEFEGYRSAKSCLGECKKERKREAYKKYSQKPEVKERQREACKKYRQKPEVRERQREYIKKYHQKPEVREKKRANERKIFAENRFLRIKQNLERAQKEHEHKNHTME